MTEDQTKVLDRLANELTAKTKEFGGTLFLIYGKDKKGMDCSGRVEGTTPHIVSNLVTVQVIDPKVRKIIETSIYAAHNLSLDAKTIIFEAEVIQK